MAFLVASFMLMVACSAPLMADESEAEITYGDETEYGALGFGAGLILGLIVGFSLGYAYAKMSDPVGNQEDIYKQLRQIYGEQYMLNADTIKDMASSILPADTSLWSFTANYWERAAELVVAESWSMGDDYDPNTTLEQSLMRDNVQNYIYDWQSAMDKAYNNILDQRQYFEGDCYGDMDYVLKWSGKQLTSPKTNMDSFFGIDFCQGVIGAKKGQYIYLDASNEDEGGSYADTSGTLYNFGKDKLTLTKMTTGMGPGGNTITVSAGSALLLQNEESGLYRIDSDNATFMGPITRASSTDSENVVDILGTLVLRSGNEMYYATASNNNVKITGTSGSSITSTNLDIVTTYTGTDKTSSTSQICNGSKYNLVRDWNNLIQQIDYVIDEAAKSGQVIWGIFDEAQAASSFISPSSLTLTVNNLNMSAGAKQAITVQGMMRIAEYWNEYGTELTEAQFITNLESEDLIVHGDIYYKGQMWMENAIFTPYLTVSSEQTLTVGKSTDWVGAGFAMVWAQTSSFSSWDGNTDLTNHKLLNLDSDYTITVHKLKVNNLPSGSSDSEVYPDTVTLTPTVIKKYTTDPTDPGGMEDPVKVLDSSQLIMIMMIELAIIIFLIGYIMGQPVIGLIVAIIVAVIGMLFSSLISDIVLGKSIFGWLFR